MDHYSFADVPPARSAPLPADEGRCAPSESTFHRVLRDHDEVARQGRAKTPICARTATTQIAIRYKHSWGAVLSPFVVSDIDFRRVRAELIRFAKGAVGILDRWH